MKHKCSAILCCFYQRTNGLLELQSCAVTTFLKSIFRSLFLFCVSFLYSLASLFSSFSKNLAYLWVSNLRNEFFPLIPYWIWLLIIVFHQSLFSSRYSMLLVLQSHLNILMQFENKLPMGIFFQCVTFNIYSWYTIFYDKVQGCPPFELKCDII